MWPQTQADPSREPSPKVLPLHISTPTCCGLAAQAIHSRLVERRGQRGLAACLPALTQPGAESGIPVSKAPFGRWRPGRRRSKEDHPGCTPFPKMQEGLQTTGPSHGFSEQNCLSPSLPLLGQSWVLPKSALN